MPNSSSPPRFDDDAVQWIAEHRHELRTPLYLYSERLMRDAVSSYRRLFPTNATLFYSLKANPQPALVQEFFALGAGAEIASEGEWNTCALAGVPPSHILVGGVSKSEDFLSTISQSTAAAVVVDSEAEWRRLQRVLPSGRPLPVLLRINPGISLAGLNMAGGSQFGLEVSQAAAIAHECAANPRSRFLGLHFYLGSQRLAVPRVLEILEVIERTVIEFRKTGPTVSVIDLGLGIGIPYLVTETPLDVPVLEEELQRRWQHETWRGIDIWVEAGRALIARAGYFVVRVTERKRLHQKTFVFVDGGMSVHNPGIAGGNLLRRNPQFRFIAESPEDEVETVTVVGNLCTSADTLGWDVTAPRLNPGDLVIVPNSGAYCATTGAWGFNSQALFSEALLRQDGTLTLCRPQHELVAIAPLQVGGRRASG